MIQQIKSYSINALIFLVRILPKRIIYSIFKGVLAIARYRKQVIINNLNIANIDTLTKAEKSALPESIQKNIARVLVETFYAPTEKLFDNIRYFNTEALEKNAEEKDGILLLASHYGNWELACMLLPKQVDIPVYGVYKPLKNSLMDEKIKHWRSRHGLHLIPRAKIARTIAENKQSGQKAIYIFIADQNPDSAKNIIWADFLGIKTAFAKGVQKLHDKYNFGIAYMAVIPREGLYRYDITIDTDFENQNITQEYSNKLEKQIVDAPQYWLWSHKRWKRKFVE